MNPIKIGFFPLNVLILFLSTLFLLSSVNSSADTYKENNTFLTEQFSDGIPEVDFIWITDELKTTVNDIMAHPYEKLRIKYWSQNDKSVWILEEMGKEKLITTGIVINNNAITLVEILAFRESRGWEIKHDFFTDQFKEATLQENKQLNQNIDGITGATLSVRAVTKLARLALFLQQQVQDEKIEF